MKPVTLSYILIIALLVVINGMLLASPNIIGKIGLVIYKYHYLKTFPRALLTIGLVVMVGLLIGTIIHSLVRNSIMAKGLGIMLLVAMLMVSGGMLVKVGMDFTSWSYRNTGLRFRIGAHLLPLILIIIFGRSFFGIILVNKKSSLLQPKDSSENENGIENPISPNRDIEQPLQP